MESTESTFHSKKWRKSDLLVKNVIDYDDENANNYSLSLK